MPMSSGCELHKTASQLHKTTCQPMKSRVLVILESALEFTIFCRTLETVYPLFAFQRFKSLKMALVFLYGVLNFNYFYILSVETFVLGAQNNFIIEIVLFITQNKCQVQWLCW